MKNNKMGFLIRHSLNKKMKSKWFLVANIIIAVVIIGLFNLDKVITMFGGNFDSKLNIVVVDKTNEVYDIFNNNMISVKDSGSFDREFEITSSTDNKEEAIKKIEKDEDIVLIFDKDETNYLKVDFITKKDIDQVAYQTMKSIINTTKTAYALVKSNIDPTILESVYKEVAINRELLNEGNNADEDTGLIMSTVFPIVILPFFMLTIFLVQMIGAEVNEEKSTKSMEIIISNVSPKTHFLSKVFSGIIFVLTQGILLFLYALIALILRSLLGSNEVIGGIGSNLNSIIETLKVSGLWDKLVYIVPLVIILMVISFIAYALVAAILAAMTTNQEDFQQIQTPIMLISLIGYYLAIMAALFKGSIFIRIISYIPFISAILSPSLLIIGDIGIIDMVASIIIMIVTIFFLFKYGLKAYKVGILNYSSSKLWTKLFKSIKSKD